MKESIVSLKAYFIIIGMIGLAIGLAHSISGSNAIISLIGVAFSVSYLYIGITLRKLLIESPEVLERIIYANIAYIILSFLFGLFSGLSVSLIRLVIGLLINWYLLNSVKRLSIDESTKDKSANKTKARAFLKTTNKDEELKSKTTLQGHFSSGLVIPDLYPSIRGAELSRFMTSMEFERIKSLRQVYVFPFVEEGDASENLCFGIGLSRMLIRNLMLVSDLSIRGPEDTPLIRVSSVGEFLAGRPSQSSCVTGQVLSASGTYIVKLLIFSETKQTSIEIRENSIESLAISCSEQACRLLDAEVEEKTRTLWSHGKAPNRDSLIRLGKAVLNSDTTLERDKLAMCRADPESTLLLWTLDGDAPGSLEAFLNALKIDPYNAQLCFQIFCAVQKSTGREPMDMQLAMQFIRRAIELSPGHGKAHMCAPHAAHASVDMIAHSELGYRLLPGNSFAVTNYIINLRAAGVEGDRLIELAEECIANDPKDPDGYKSAIEFLSASGEHKRALYLAERLATLYGPPMDKRTRYCLEQNPTRKALLQSGQWDPAAEHQELMGQLRKAVLEASDALNLSGQFEEAIASYDRTLEDDPENVAAWINRGSALGELGRYEDAIVSYDRALEIRSDIADAWYNRGYALNQLSRYEDAITSYDRALEFRPDDSEVWNRRGIALSLLARHDEAISSFDRALEIEPNKSEAWTNRGITLNSLSQYEDALTSLERALDIEPNAPEAHYNQGNALDRLGRHEEAINSYNRTLAIVPNHTRALIKKGNACLASGRYEEAIPCYDRALEIEPNDYETWYNRGTALEEVERSEEAITSFDRSLAINPTLYLAWRDRGNSQINTQQYEAAISSLERALELDNSDYVVWYIQGALLEQQGRYKEAVTSLDRALEIEPRLHQIWNKKGQILHQIGKHKDAIVSFDRVLELEPNLHEVWNLRGASLDELGRYEEAILSYDRALELEPEKYTTWFNKALALQYLERFEEALLSLDRALKIRPNLYQAWGNRSIVLIRLGRYEEAIASSNRVLEFDSSLYEAWYMRARSYALLNRIEESLADLRQAIKLSPNCRKSASSESDFDQIRNTSAFKSLINLEGD